MNNEEREIMREILDTVTIIRTEIQENVSLIYDTLGMQKLLLEKISKSVDPREAENIRKNIVRQLKNTEANLKVLDALRSILDTNKLTNPN